MSGYEHLKYPRRKCFNSQEEQEQKKRAETYEEFTKKGWGGIYHKLECVKCGKIFYARRGTSKYCGYRCKNDAQIEFRRQRHVNKRKKHCTLCGQFFEAIRDDTVFCSSACKQKWYRQKNVTDKGFGNVHQPKNVTDVTDIGLADIGSTQISNTEAQP